MLRLLIFMCFLTTLAAAQVEIQLVKEMDELDQTNVVLKNEFWENSQWTWRLDPEAEPRTDWERHRDLGQTFTAPKTFWLDKFYFEISNGANSPENLNACQNAPVHCMIVEFDPEAAIPDSKVPPIDTLTHQGGTLPAQIDSAEIANYGLGMLLEWDIEDIQLEEGKFYGILMQFDSLQSNQRMQIEKTHGRYEGGTMLVVYFNGTDGRANVTEWQWSHGGHGNNPVRDLRFFLIEAEGPPAAVESEPISVPQTLTLAQNYPNPFNPTTSIAFELPVAGHIRLDVLSATGSHVATLLNQNMPTGRAQVQWQGTDKSGNNVASGLYLYRLQYGDEVRVKKMLLMR